MRVNREKILALFLSLMLVLGLIPLGVLAEDLSVTNNTDSSSSSSLETNAAEPKLITAFAELAVVELELDKELTEEALLATFPKSLVATVQGEEDSLEVPVSGWTLAFSSHSSDAFATDEKAEIYYEPTLTIPEGYEISNEMAQPAQKVQVGEALLHGPMLASLTGSDFVVTGDASNYSWDNTNKVLTITGSGGSLVNDGTIYRHGTITGEITLTGAGQFLPADGTPSPTVYLNATPVYLRENGTDKQISYDKGVSWQNYTGEITLTGTTTTNNVQVLSGMHDIILNDLKIQLTTSQISPFEIKGTAVANITLRGANILQTNQPDVALKVQSGSILNITKASGGTLEVRGDGTSIGGTGAIINIAGGAVTAIGGRSSVGIEGIIAISGGTVGAKGGTALVVGDVGGVGISGPLTITGGTVTSTGGAGAQAFSAKPIIPVPENQMAKVDILAGDASPGSPVLPSSDYHINQYAQITFFSAQTPNIVYGADPGVYTGAPQTLSVTSVTLGGTPLTVTNDYTVSGNTATNAGEYTLTITGAGNYIGTVTKTYTIKRATLTITGATAQSRAYDGTTNATADVSFGGLLNGETLTNGTDYTVSATFSDSDVGDNLTITGVVQLTGTAASNNYIFSNAEFSFPTAASITPLSLAGAQVTLGAPLVANGTLQTQSIASITLGNLILADGTDYTVSGNTATGVGGYTLTITGVGNYSGTLEVPFTVVGTAAETLTYNPTGTVDLGNSTVPGGNTLHVTERSETQKQQDFEKLHNYAQKNNITGTVHFLADITMKDASGSEVQPQNGNTRIRISVPGVTAADTVTVLHIKDDGTVEEIRPVDVYNGYVEFYPTSFSVYNVIVHKASTVGGVTTPLSPQTGVYALPDVRES